MAGDWLPHYWTVMLVDESRTPELTGLYRKQKRAEEAAARWNINYSGNGTRAIAWRILPPLSDRSHSLEEKAREEETP
jgi:hypothetical protein